MAAKTPKSETGKNKTLMLKRSTVRDLTARRDAPDAVRGAAQCLRPGPCPAGVSSEAIAAPEMLGTAAYLRQLHVARYPSHAISLVEAYRISTMLANVQNYLVRRAADPLADGRVPAFIAALYKAALGVSSITYDVREPMGEGRRRSGADRSRCHLRLHRMGRGVHR